MAHTNLSHSSLRILQWNCLSFFQRKCHLLQISDHYDIIILLESKLSPDRQASLPNFVAIRNDHTLGGGGGIVIFLKNDIPFRTVDSIPNTPLVLETLSIDITTSQGELLIVDFYRPPSPTIPSNLWRSLVNATSNYESVFVGGDFNCHNTIWGSSHTCQVGQEIPLPFTDNDVILLNDGSPTFSNRSAAACPA